MRLRHRVSRRRRRRSDRRRPRRVLIGGIGYHWMGDVSFGLVVSARLSRLDWPAGIEVADLDYGAIYAAQDLANASPPYERLILIAAVERGRRPGTLTSYRPARRPLDADDVQARMREAGGGVVDLDHLLIIAQHFAALPADVVVIELEPTDLRHGDGLSAQAAALLTTAIEHVRSQAFAARRKSDGVVPQRRRLGAAAARP